MRIPQYDPINTVQDLVNQKVTIIEVNWLLAGYREYYLGLNISEWKDVANSMVPATWGCKSEAKICADINGTWAYFSKHHVHGNKTHAFIRGQLSMLDLKLIPQKNNWWRSDKLEYGSNPYAGVVTSRNWILNEVK